MFTTLACIQYAFAEHTCMRGLFLLSMGLSLTGVAEAAPWTRDDNGFYARAALSAEEIDGLEAVRLDLYGEYGLTQKWTVTAKSEAVSYFESADFNSETARVTLRRQIYSKNGWVAAIEGGPIYGTAVAGVFGCDTIGAEARISGGISGRRLNRDFYAFSDIAVMAYEDGCRRERAEIGYGVELRPEWWLSQQIWLEQGTTSATSHKLETFLSYRFEVAEVGIGYREEIGGRFDERGIVASVTVRR